MSDEFDQIRDQITSDVMDKGVINYWQHDVNSVMHRGSPWAYTVGRTLSGRAELLVTGLDEETSSALLTELADVDIVPEDAMQTSVGLVFFLPAERAMMHAAFAVFGTRFTALQVVHSGDPQPLHMQGGLIPTDPYPPG